MMNSIAKNALLTPFNLLYKLSPRLLLRFLFRMKLGYRLNLDNHRTYNEKPQRIKLYDRNPLTTVRCDKYAVRATWGKGLGGILKRPFWEDFDPAGIPFDGLLDRSIIKVYDGITGRMAGR